MSFLIDLLLVAVGVWTVIVYSRRSLFAALTGLLSVAVAAVAAVCLTNTLAVPVRDYVIAPTVQQQAANDLADMFSAPHLSGGKQTVASLPVADLVKEEPDAYLQLIQKYGADAGEVKAAYAQSPSPVTVLVKMTENCTKSVSAAIAFTAILVLLALAFRLLFRGWEQNFPPQRRYRGIKRVVPYLIGVPAAFVWMWAVVFVFSLIIPVLAGQLTFIGADALRSADWYSILRLCDPLLWIYPYF